uniref:S-methyl-5'-thioadenosine phosphorylase n=1 Tax=Strigamia maritima TaxID=126957 RepID=T1JKL3_STRMM
MICWKESEKAVGEIDLGPTVSVAAVREIFKQNVQTVITLFTTAVPKLVLKDWTPILLENKVGIIGGSGLDDPNILEKRKEIVVTTPFGDPSDALIEGTIKGVTCVLLARHGRGHTIMPSNVNYRANIWALKDRGCTHLIVSTACGSLDENIHPGDIVFLDQFIDRTTKRPNTFYDGAPNSPNGVCHVPMHTPFCPSTTKILIDSAVELGVKHHVSGTVITIEGPRFSTRGESKLFRTWGAHVINMTTVPEAILAKEAGLCYAAVALATDYDCWKESEKAVSAAAVLETFQRNVQTVITLFTTAVPKLVSKDWTPILLENKEISQSSIMPTN